MKKETRLDILPVVTLALLVVVLILVFILLVLFVTETDALVSEPCLYGIDAARGAAFEAYQKPTLFNSQEWTRQVEGYLMQVRTYCPGRIQVKAVQYETALYSGDVIGLLKALR